MLLLETIRTDAAAVVVVVAADQSTAVVTAAVVKRINPELCRLWNLQTIDAADTIIAAVAVGFAAAVLLLLLQSASID